ncbi:hypothetical protein ADUPG1_013469, partial [Aduncisulcus paluster]
MFVWTSECQQEFDKLIEVLISKPILAHIDYDCKLVLRTDASIDGCGGVLLQIRDGKEEVIEYLSNSFSTAQKKWSTIEQEAYGIVYCLKRCEGYLRGHRFELQTDHRNLLYMEKSESPKIVRWRLLMQEFDYELSHIPGRDNVPADFMSRYGHVAVVKAIGQDVSKKDIVRNVHGRGMEDHSGIKGT